MESQNHASQVGQQPQQPMPPQRNNLSQQALQQLLETLKLPHSPAQQKQILTILKSNPQVMAAFIKHRQQEQQQQLPQPNMQAAGWLVPQQMAQQNIQQQYDHDTSSTWPNHPLHGSWQRGGTRRSSRNGGSLHGTVGGRITRRSATVGGVTLHHVPSRVPERRWGQIREPMQAQQPVSAQPSIAGVGVGGTAGGSQASAADPGKRKLIQRQLVLLLHAHKCQWRETQANGEVKPCALPHCRTMKNVLNHITNCQAGKSCPVAHCASSRQIISHWKNCRRNDCPVCLPLKNASDRDHVPTSQILQNFASPVDQTSVAYAFEGLSMNRTQTRMPGIPDTAGNLLSQQNMQQSTNVPGNFPRPVIKEGINVSATASCLPTAMPSSATSQPWHAYVTPYLRAHLVHKLVQALFPSPDQAALQDKRMGNLVEYAQKMEEDVYKQASSREEYYHLLAEKINKIQKELEEDR